MGLLQVQTMAAEARKAAVAQLQHQVEACQVRAVKQCATALEARWPHEMPQDPQQWAAELVQTYEECKAEDSLASYAQDQVKCISDQHMIFISSHACQNFFVDSDSVCFCMWHLVNTYLLLLCAIWRRCSVQL